MVQKGVIIDNYKIILLTIIASLIIVFLIVLHFSDYIVVGRSEQEIHRENFKQIIFDEVSLNRNTLNQGPDEIYEKFLKTNKGCCKAFLYQKIISPFGNISIFDKIFAFMESLFGVHQYLYEIRYYDKSGILVNIRAYYDASGKKLEVVRTKK